DFRYVSNSFKFLTIEEVDTYIVFDRLLIVVYFVSENAIKNNKNNNLSFVVSGKSYDLAFNTRSSKICLPTCFSLSSMYYTYFGNDFIPISTALRISS